MTNFVNKEKGKQVELYCTFKIILKSFKPYKLMTIYTLEEKKNNIILACVLCIKYTDS